MSDEEKAAQVRLDKLCKEHSVEKFSIRDDVGLVCWRNLIQAMCGMDINRREKPGRKGNSDDLVDEVRRLYALYTDFSRLEIDESKDKTDKKRYKNLPDFYKYQVYGFISDDLSKKYGKEITSNQVRGILKNDHNSEQLKRLNLSNTAQNSFSFILLLTC
ncbi:MAG: hypothetical protein HYS17_02345 [Micavibrio aeruginosavorus]|uniref:Uncharacterized protein n=1 Tax=Micavibrio aeruginosavorus TaxID=349221 RepID=A0A7T5R315_9BACT|nr:MAG: hypothetical protein HYS17_02345 [Micavibrio aeruginosavorus]